MKVTEEFIKELHGTDNIECVKARIEKEWPELFDCEFKVGEWYGDDRSKCCYQVTNVLGNDYYAYGFDWKGIWRDEKMFGKVDDFTVRNPPKKATHQEVETALIKEAKRRGFKEGVRVTDARDGESMQIFGDSFNWSWGGEHCDSELRSSTIDSDRYCVVFVKGKWATPIESKKDMTVEQIEKQLGHGVNVVSNK